MSDAATKLGSSAITGLIGVWGESRRRRLDDERTQRREAAADLLAWIPELRNRLLLLEAEYDIQAWRDLMTRAYASARRVEQTVPHGWTHLRQSLWDAVGSGAGSVAWIDLDPTFVEPGLSYHHRWTSNAVEYLEYVQAKVQRWHNAYGSRRARKVVLLSYNNWLLKTGLWSPNEYSTTL